MPSHRTRKSILSRTCNEIPKARLSATQSRVPFAASHVAIAVTVLSFVTTVHAADYFPPPDSDGGWRTLKDPKQIRELAGMDAKRLDNAFEFTQRCSQNGGLLVVRHGYLVFERYFGRAARDANPDMASTGQSIHQHRLRNHAQRVSRQNS